MKEHKDLTVIIEQDAAGSYIAYVPDLPGCRVQGKSLAEVQELIKKAIQQGLGDCDASIKLEHLK